MSKFTNSVFTTIIGTLACINASSVQAGGKISDCVILKTATLYDDHGRFDGEPLNSFITRRQNSKVYDTISLIEHYSEDGIEKLIFGDNTYYRYNLTTLNYQNSHGQVLKLFRKKFDGDTILMKLDLNAWQELNDAFAEVEMWRCNVTSFIPETDQERANGYQKGVKRGQAFKQYLETLREIDGYCRDDIFCQ